MRKKDYCKPKGFFLSRKESNYRKCREQRYRDEPTTSQNFNVSFTTNTSDSPPIQSISNGQTPSPPPSQTPSPPSSPPPSQTPSPPPSQPPSPPPSQPPSQPPSPPPSQSNAQHSQDTSLQLPFPSSTPVIQQISLPDLFNRRRYYY